MRISKTVNIYICLDNTLIAMLQRDEFYQTSVVLCVIISIEPLSTVKKYYHVLTEDTGI